MNSAMDHREGLAAQREWAWSVPGKNFLCHAHGTIRTAVDLHGLGHAGEAFPGDEFAEQGSGEGGFFRTAAAAGEFEELGVAFLLARDGVVDDGGDGGGEQARKAVAGAGDPGSYLDSFCLP